MKKKKKLKKKEKRIEKETPKTLKNINYSLRSVLIRVIKMLLNGLINLKQFVTGEFGRPWDLDWDVKAKADKGNHPMYEYYLSKRMVGGRFKKKEEFLPPATSFPWIITEIKKGNPWEMLSLIALVERRRQKEG